jgi:hypothetical protein
VARGREAEMGAVIDRTVVFFCAMQNSTEHGNIRNLFIKN